MTDTSLGNYPQRPIAGSCQNAYIISRRSLDAASSFLDTFVAVRKERQAIGTPTDEEQDLLRGMLVFSCAGLDSLVKQLIREALPSVIDQAAGAEEMFRVFIERRLSRGDKFDHRLLADVLAERDPRARLARELVRDLTSGSLQSKEELFRAASYFDIPTHVLTSSPDLVQEIFEARNQIVHEMDIDFGQSNRNCRPRRKKAFIDYSKEVFRLGGVFLAEVDRRL